LPDLRGIAIQRTLLERLREHLPIGLLGALIDLLRGDQQQLGPLDADGSGLGGRPATRQNCCDGDDAKTEYRIS
jgi:hypothetical protein